MKYALFQDEVGNFVKNTENFGNCRCLPLFKAGFKRPKREKRRKNKGLAYLVLAVGSRLKIFSRLAVSQTASRLIS